MSITIFVKDESEKLLSYDIPIDGTVYTLVNLFQRSPWNIHFNGITLPEDLETPIAETGICQETMLELSKERWRPYSNNQTRDIVCMLAMKDNHFRVTPDIKPIMQKSHSTSVPVQVFDIEDWDMRGMHSLSGLFRFLTNFNENISKWDVSNVTNMYMMFQDNWYFDQDISNWNVSNVTNMTKMFQGATRFNQDISKWNVSNVKHFNGMLEDADLFNQDITVWNISNETFNELFHYSDSSSQDVSESEVSSTDLESLTDD